MSNYIFNLKGINSVFDTTISNEISDNLVEFFNWGLLNKGNYLNVSLNETKNGVDISRLNPSESKSFAPGKAWDSQNKGWVCESGFSYTVQPIYVSGIYVNDVFYPSDTSGVYQHYIDYNNGRVVFNSAVSSTKKVQVEYSYKWINIEYAESFDGIKTLEKTNLPESYIKTPVIAIETVGNIPSEGYQLGGGQYLNNKVLFHCYAEDDTIRDRLMDIVMFQNNKTIILFDSNKIYESGEFPMDYRGFPVQNAMNYMELVNKYPGYPLRFKDMTSNKSETKDSSLFGGVVKSVVEIIKLNI
jgi:hypothetical protein